MYLDAHTILKVVQSFSVEERQSKAQQRLHYQEEQLLLPYQPHGVVVAVTNVLRSVRSARGLSQFRVEELRSLYRIVATLIVLRLHSNVEIRKDYTI
jgi:hypothetical protein